MKNCDNNNLLISDNIVSEGELALALGYLIGDTCLYRAACEEPRVAREYLGAAEMLLQTMKLVPQYVCKNEHQRICTERTKRTDVPIN
jgi:hypothetical protein